MSLSSGGLPSETQRTAGGYNITITAESSEGTVRQRFTLTT
jgi:hypothetical protein